MKKQCLKTTVVAVSLIAGSLISACANSGGQTAEGNPGQASTSGKPLPIPLPKAAEDALTITTGDLSVVFAVDKKGNVHAFAPKGSTIEPGARPFPSRGKPLPAADIVQLNTISTFQTSNPKTCWVTHGLLRCITWQ
jgi:hypothetical protein